MTFRLLFPEVELLCQVLIVGCDLTENLASSLQRPDIAALLRLGGGRGNRPLTLQCLCLAGRHIATTSMPPPKRHKELLMVIW